MGASITWPANPGNQIADLDLVFLSNFNTTEAESVAVPIRFIDGQQAQDEFSRDTVEQLSTAVSKDINYTLSIVL